MAAAEEKEEEEEEERKEEEVEQEKEGMSHTMKALCHLHVGPGRHMDVGTIR